MTKKNPEFLFQSSFTTQNTFQNFDSNRLMTQKTVLNIDSN